jgi:hypothetical protein
MDDQRTNRASGGSVNRKIIARFQLKWLLIVFIPLSAMLTIYHRYSVHRERVQNAYDRMNGLVFDAHFNPNGDCILFARKGNVTDNDLKALIPIATGEAGLGSHKVIRLELCGSKVSDGIVSLFRDSGPECELVR